MTISFILGGARSGKSKRGQALAEAATPKCVYIATAEALDKEMMERIAKHRAGRSSAWQTIEEPLDLAGVIRATSAKDSAILVDCLTLWLSNIMHAEQNIDDKTDELIHSIRSAPGPLVLISNEVGMGIVPDTPLGRDFRDAQGRLNQRIAEAADIVEFVAAGLPLRLKG